MTPRVVGAGLGRTGTTSLKAALERLLGEPCYHMATVGEHPEHAALWGRAYAGDLPDWPTFLAGFGASVDWPASPFWAEQADAFPDAMILLSERDPDAWWTSVTNTIWRHMESAYRPDPADEAGARMLRGMMAAFSPDWRDETAAKAAFVAHNDHVRATAPPDRLLEWQAADGWVPICRALDVAVPDEPFPHKNTTADMQRRMAERDRS